MDWGKLEEKKPTHYYFISQLHGKRSLKSHCRKSALPSDFSLVELRVMWHRA